MWRTGFIFLGLAILGFGLGYAFVNLVGFWDFTRTWFPPGTIIGTGGFMILVVYLYDWLESEKVEEN